jgi:tRNA (guanine9-N1)-methyltransferase
MNDGGYKRWAKTEWWTEGYERLWGTTETDNVVDVPRTEGEMPNISKPTACTKETVIYLTADSNDELSELKPDENYIIGGIVDRNRYKARPSLSFIVLIGTHLRRLQNLCENKAREANIRTARLPIGKYLANLPTRKVLTVNQVFEILVKWAETKDWEVALNHVMPKRKFNADGKHGKGKGLGNEDEEEEHADSTEVTAGSQAGAGVGERHDTSSLAENADHNTSDYRST